MFRVNGTSTVEREVLGVPVPRVGLPPPDPPLDPGALLRQTAVERPAEGGVLLGRGTDVHVAVGGRQNHTGLGRFRKQLGQLSNVVSCVLYGSSTCYPRDRSVPPQEDRTRPSSSRPI